MATRREVRRSVGRFQHQGRRLMEVFGTATAGASGTVDVAELAFYPAETDYFDGYGVSSVGGTGYGTDGRVTAFTQGSNRLTFVPVATFDNTSLIEVWQSGLDATAVNDCINQAIDSIQDQVLQFESHLLYAFEENRWGGLRREYPLPTGLKFVYSVQVLRQWPVLGYAARNMDAFRSLDIAAGSAQLAMGFKVPTTDIYRGLVLWLRKQGTISTARTLTCNVEGNSGSVPDNSEVSGATATFSTDNIYAEVVPCFFDFGRPVNLVAGTQYHLTLDISGTLDASNYIEWAEDNTSPGYGDGALSTGTSGNAWTAVSGSDMIFSIVPWGTDFIELPGNEWELVPGPSRTLLRYLGAEGRPQYTGMGSSLVPMEGQPMRVLAYSRADRPTSDTADLEVPRSYLEAKTLALVLARVGADKDTIAFWTTLAMDEWRRHGVPTGLQPNSREVTPT